MTKEQYLSTQYISEKQFTAATFRYINASYPQLRHLFFHVPNEQATSDRMRMEMTTMGVLPGVPDFVFVWPVTWGLELKHGNGLPSAKQASLHRLWQDKGISVVTCWTPEQVLWALEKYVN